MPKVEIKWNAKNTQTMKKKRANHLTTMKYYTTMKKNDLLFTNTHVLVH